VHDIPLESPVVELLDSRELEQFLPVLREVELGDPFLLSMLHWCGYGKRSTPLAYWQVYLVRHGSEVVGVVGLYQRNETAKHIHWLGWFGIMPLWRRKHFGSAAVRQVIAKAKERGGRELWVYIGQNDSQAAQFYINVGFELLGTACDKAPDQTINNTDTILRLYI
jgi:GNAT superfamily N-acetyltransferase